MNRKEAKTRIAVLLSAGTRKADALAELSGQGLKDRVLAHLIASRPDPERCRQNKLHIRILVALGIAQLAISLMLAYYFFHRRRQRPRAGIPRADRAAVAAVHLGLCNPSCRRVPRVHPAVAAAGAEDHRRLGRDPSTALPSLAITVLLVGYVWFVRNRLFPDYGWFTPRKVEGRYAFVEHA